MGSSKKRLKQFEHFRSKLKPSGLPFLQETHSTIDCEKIRLPFHLTKSPRIY